MTGARGLLAAILLLTAMSGAAASGVELEAPAPLDDFLRRHLDLPEKAGSATERAALARRLPREITGLLATEGYFSPAIDLRTDAPETLRIMVTPGPQTQVGEVRIAFTGHLGGAAPALEERRAALRAGWSLPPGSPFRSEDWEKAKKALLAAVAEEDYATARYAATRAEVDPERAQARLELAIDSGPAWRFGPLRIEGLKRYDAEVVELLATFAPGQPYRRSRLLSFQSRVQNTTWFHSVTVEALTDQAVSDAEAVAPVRVTLAESPSKQVGFGAGYSTNTGARGEAHFRHHDLFGRAWTLHTGLRYEQLRQSAFADLALLPDARGYRPAFAGRIEASDIEGLATTRQALSAARSRTEKLIETRLGIEWQREERRPDGAPADVYRTLALDWRWIRRAADDALDPRRGNVVELRLGGATRRIVSDRDFARAYLRVQQWWPLAWPGPNDVLTLRAELGHTLAGSRFGIPQEYLFRAGGTQSVRGYAYQSLGVREGSAVVGGRALATASVEYTHWLAPDDMAPGKWGIAAFVDAGDAADDWRSLEAAVGTGVGVRWKSPAGPLALDVARGRAHGGRDPQWQLHFSLMVAF